jgi:hypothetical protein
VSLCQPSFIVSRSGRTAETELPREPIHPPPKVAERYCLSSSYTDLRRLFVRQEIIPMSRPEPAAQAIVIPVTTPSRHALGLPAGSIRALLALLVVGLVCAQLLILIKGEYKPLPAYLLYLLFLILGHYFAAHGNTIRRRGQSGPSPLYLPSGMVRFVIVIALAGTIGWKWINHPDTLEQQLRASVTGITDQPFLPLVLLAGFLLGVVVRTLVGRQNPPYWWQDIEAWFALIGTLGLAIEVLIRLVINPSLTHPLNLPDWEGFLAGVVAFYFGARS